MATPQENCLIGLCDGAIDRSKHLSTFLTNKIGGEPDQLPTVSLRYPRCSLCSSPLAHVVQVYCPLDASPYHRTINVFACANSACHEKPDSWKVLRSQCLESDIKYSAEGTGVQAPSVQEAPMASTDWCDDADDWDVEEDCSATWTTVQTETSQNAIRCAAEVALDVSSQLHSLSISTVEEAQLRGPIFQPFYISVVEESDFVADSGMEHAQKLLREYEQREGPTLLELGGCEGGEERYEKTEARHGDAVFSGFMKKISLCPEQVLRYCRNSSPLFISKQPSDLKQIVPPCSHCGNSRTFEFQLMPALVSLLRISDQNLGLAVEFGTVLVYTCQSSCWTSGSNSPVEEFTFVQADPDQKFFK